MCKWNCWIAQGISMLYVDDRFALIFWALGRKFVIFFYIYHLMDCQITNEQIRTQIICSEESVRLHCNEILVPIYKESYT